MTLSINDFPNTEESFAIIADKLFNEYEIQAADGQRYQLVEIEFYWYAKDHKDGSVYKRNHAYPGIGEWFFHYSGVDISLGSGDGESQGYGGILIRKIRNTNETKVDDGPLICMMKIFSGVNVFKEDAIFPRLIALEEHQKSAYLPQKSVRKGLGANAGDFKDKEYRYYIDFQKVKP